MPPSRPMDAPVARLTSDDHVLTNSVRNCNRPSPATTISNRLVEPWRPTNRKPQYKNKPAANPPTAGPKIRYELAIRYATANGSPGMM